MTIVEFEFDTLYYWAAWFFKFKGWNVNRIFAHCSFAVSMLLVLLVSSLAFGQFGEVQAPPNQLKPGFDFITPERCESFLDVLAGPAFEGRGSGQIGYTKAAHWVAGRVAQWGFQPVGDGGTFFQLMPVTRKIPVLAETQIMGPGGLELSGEGNIGFERYTDAAIISGEIVFLDVRGANPSIPENIPLRDKIVLYSVDEAAAAVTPRLLAQNRPTAAIRIIDGVPTSRPQIIFEGRRRRSTSVSGTMSRSAASAIMKACGLREPTLQNPGTIIRPTQEKLSIRLRMREVKATTPNVVALLEGSDPNLKHEYVVLGAHLDHLGHRGGQIYYGADDNGSGSSAVLAIAEAMANNPVKPKRSVLFMWFAAEEVGLVGSRYYTEHPLLPLENMTCMLNIDMVGRNEETSEETSADNEGHIHLVGSRRGESDLHNLILSTNRHIGFEFEYDEERVFSRSDQINFYRKGVPVAFLFGGFHPDYHQTTDQRGKINYHKIATAARLFYLTAYAAADHGRFELKADDQ